MGIGDNLMASGMARGAWARGKRIAFGNGHKIVWDQHSEMIFRGNPNIARPGMVNGRHVEWIRYHKGHRVYNRHDVSNDRWVWNYDFRAVPGEVYFDDREKKEGARYGSGFVLVEPEVVSWKSSAPNKDWGRSNYQKVVDALKSGGCRVCQFVHDKSEAPLEGVEPLRTRGFRDALAVLSHASMYIGPEGGLHHGAAAVGIPAVVIFGGFIPPQVTGYPGHKNLTGGAEACGSLKPCRHCQDAMQRITVEEVVESARDVSEWTE